MKIEPLRDNVVISPKKEEEKNKTEAGIYLPETAETENKKPQMGEVIAIGDSDEIKVKKGQTIIYNKYAGTEVMLDGKEYLIVKNEDILAVVE